MTRRRRRLLISQARDDVDRFKTKVMNQVLGTNITDPNDVKMEVAKQLDIPLKRSGNGEIRAEDAGKIGGAIGGQMVKEMVRLAQESLRKSGK